MGKQRYDLDKKIAAALKDKYGIDATVKDGVVSVDGFEEKLSLANERSLAELAAKIKGVR